MVKECVLNFVKFINHSIPKNVLIVVNYMLLKKDNNIVPQKIVLLLQLDKITYVQIHASYIIQKTKRNIVKQSVITITKSVKSIINVYLNAIIDYQMMIKKFVQQKTVIQHKQQMALNNVLMNVNITQLIHLILVNSSVVNVVAMK